MLEKQNNNTSRRHRFFQVLHDTTQSWIGGPKRRTIVIMGTAALLLVALAGYAIQQTMFRDAGHMIPTDVVRRGQFLVRITEVGEMRALNSQFIKSSFWGKIAWLIPEGSVVEAGEPVLRMDTGEIERNIQQREEDMARAQSRLEKKKEEVRLSLFRKEMEVKSAEADLEEKELDLEEAKREYEREKLLFEHKMTSMEAVERTRLRVSGAQLDLEMSQMAVERALRDQESSKKVQEEATRQVELELQEAQSDLEESREWLSNATVHSPGPGMIVYLKKYKRGIGFAKVQEGDQVWWGEKLLEIPDLSEMTVEIKVNEMDISRVQVGQEALVRVDAFSKLLLHGQATDIGSLELDTGDIEDEEVQQGVNIFTATVLVDKEELKAQQMSSASIDTSRQEVKLARNPIIRQGMTASVDIIVQSFDDAVFVPLESVFRTGDAYVVFVMEGGVSTQRVVTVGERNESDIIIRSGLREGEEVCLEDPTGKLSGPTQWLPELAAAQGTSPEGEE